MNRQENNTEPLISVIVPVYNDAPFLCRCIDSILEQTYEKLEILLVDDGSTDDSGTICDKYALKDYRVKSVHKSNGGTVSARKYGLENAQGQLISFIDGDDWIDKVMYEKMLEFWKQNEYPDIVSSGILYEYPGFDEQKKIQDGADEGLYDRKSVIDELIPGLICNPIDYQNMVLTSICSKLINKVVAKDAMEYMQESLSIGEDGAYTYFLTSCCTSFYVTHNAYYHYEQHEGSQNNDYSIDVISRLSQLERVMTEGMHKLIWNSQIQTQIAHFVWEYLYNIIRANFHFEMKKFLYLFPYEKCDKDKTIILYGAGEVGNAYMQCLEKSRFAKKSILVDKNYRKLREQGKPVVSLEEALQEQYDYVVIALENESNADFVKEELLIRGVPEDKLIWEKPIRIYLQG